MVSAPLLVLSSLLVVKKGDELAVEGAAGGGGRGLHVHVALQVVVPLVGAAERHPDTQVGHAAAEDPGHLTVLEHTTVGDVLGALDGSGDTATGLEHGRGTGGGGCSCGGGGGGSFG